MPGVGDSSDAGAVVNMKGYLGSKAGVWQRIAAEIPLHDLLIVPFAGHCALSRKLQPAPKRLLFDLDVRVCDFWDDVQQRDDVDLACYNQNGIEYLEAIVSACDSEELMEFPRWAAPEFESQVEQLEWVDQRVVIYCDPPYLVSTRTSRESRYRHDMTDADHERLLSVIRRLPCRVIISGYDSQLHRERLSDWRLVTFNATTRGKSKVRTECLWSNREQPSVTHMPVMVGTDKRQRETLKRRLDRIEAKAARIAPSDVQQWLTCLSRRADATAASPVLVARATEEPMPTREQSKRGIAACGKALCSSTSHHPLCAWADKFDVDPFYARLLDRPSPQSAATAAAVEVLREIALPPWSDSDPASLLETLRSRAVDVLARYPHLEAASPETS